MTGSFTTLTFEQIGHVRRITLNRPEQHNPLTPRCVREVLAAVAQADADAEARVLVIRSTGRSFSSGYGFIAEDTDPGDFTPHQSIEDDASAMLLFKAFDDDHGRCGEPPPSFFSSQRANTESG